MGKEVQIAEPRENEKESLAAWTQTVLYFVSLLILYPTSLQ